MPKHFNESNDKVHFENCSIISLVKHVYQTEIIVVFKALKNEVCVETVHLYLFFCDFDVVDLTLQIKIKVARCIQDSVQIDIGNA